MRNSRIATLLLIALVVGAVYLKFAKPPRYDPNRGELVVPTEAAKKVNVPAKAKWLELAQTVIHVAESKIDIANAKARAKSQLADLAEVVGNMGGVGPDLRKLVELTNEEFVALGRACARELDSVNKAIELPDPRAVRLSALVSPHAGEDGIQLSVKLYDNPVIRAFALPDGSVRISSGLLAIADDDEVRGVLGHELGHVILQHSKAYARVAILTSAGAKAVLKATSGDDAKPGVIADVAAEIAKPLVETRYSRAKEQQADDFAFAFVMAYGYQPEALVSLFGKLGPGREASVFDSHPPSAARASRMRELIAKAKKQ